VRANLHGAPQQATGISHSLSGLKLPPLRSRLRAMAASRLWPSRLNSPDGKSGARLGCTPGKAAKAETKITSGPRPDQSRRAPTLLAVLGRRPAAPMERRWALARRSIYARMRGSILAVASSSRSRSTHIARRPANQKSGSQRVRQPTEPRLNFGLTRVEKVRNSAMTRLKSFEFYNAPHEIRGSNRTTNLGPRSSNLFGRAKTTRTLGRSTPPVLALPDGPPRPAPGIPMSMWRHRC
jgi:hypothetical protein